MIYFILFYFLRVGLLANISYPIFMNAYSYSFDKSIKGRPYFHHFTVNAYASSHGDGQLCIPLYIETSMKKKIKALKRTSRKPHKKPF